MKEKNLKDTFNPYEIHFDDMSPERQEEFLASQAEKEATVARESTPEFKKALDDLSESLDSGEIDGSEYVSQFVELHCS